MEEDVDHRFIADLRPGERIEDQVFLIRAKDLRTTTQGSLYIHAVLIDRTGQLVARAWQATEEQFRVDVQDQDIQRQAQEELVLDPVAGGVRKPRKDGSSTGRNRNGAYTGS